MTTIPLETGEDRSWARDVFIVCEGRCNPNIKAYDAAARDAIFTGTASGKVLRIAWAFDRMVHLGRQLRHPLHSPLNPYEAVCSVCGQVRRWGIPKPRPTRKYVRRAGFRADSSRNPRVPPADGPRAA